MARESPPEPPSTLSADDWPRANGRIVWRRLLQRRLLLRVTIPTAIGLVQLALAIAAIAAGNARPVLLLWAVPALLIGALFGMGAKVAWNDETAQIAVIQTQVWLSVAYIVVRVGSHFLLEATLSSRVNGLATALLLVSCGLFLGRSLGLSGQIWKALVRHGEEEPAGAPPP